MKRRVAQVSCFRTCVHLPSAEISGAAITVSCQPGDNLMIHAMETVHKGDILVVTTSSPSTDGMFGDLLGASCQAHGMVGLIILKRAVTQ